MVSFDTRDDYVLFGELDGELGSQRRRRIRRRVRV